MGKSSRHRSPSTSDSASSSSSCSDEEERREQKRKRHSREKKHKKEKKSKKHKKDSEKELVKAAKKLLKEQQRAEAQQVVAQHTVHNNQALVKQQLTEADYFLKHAEFTTWLLEAKSRYFSDLSAEESRVQFEEFAEQWNAGRLAAKYYAGTVAAPAARTTYRWAFKGEAPMHGKSSVGMNAFLDDSDNRRVQLKEEYKADRRKWRAEQRTELDELLPKATGREAAVEKKLARREEARVRAESPDLVKLPGGGTDVMGGGDSFAEARAREARKEQMRRNRGVARMEEVQQRAQQYQAAEDAKMAQFRALVASGPISIPKRQ